MTELQKLLERSCASIAPTWPLDRFIAVNPFWPRIAQPISSVARDLMALRGADLLMPRAWYRTAWEEGRFEERHLQSAIDELGAPVKPCELRELLNSAPPPNSVRARFMDVVDSESKSAPGRTWREYVVQSTSQFCASYYDEGQAQIRPNTSEGLYRTWVRHTRRDKSPRFAMGLHDYEAHAATLPTDVEEMATFALEALRIPVAEQEAYLSSLLLDVNGWASWCAYRRWTARLAGDDDKDIVELLGIRLAWEWILFRVNGSVMQKPWERAKDSWQRSTEDAAKRDNDWLFQRALELAWQEKACARLRSQSYEPAVTSEIDVQAVFCIDVRSERFRRALESQSDRIETRGFAGFFGVPAAYRSHGTSPQVPHVPGLIAPRMQVTDVNVTEAATKQKETSIWAEDAWRQFKSFGAASFFFVEAAGAWFAGKLAAETLGIGASAASSRRASTSADAGHPRPRLTGDTNGAPLPLPQKTELAQGILRGMSLTRNFAKFVLLVGHGSSSRNNPHAAGLDCGACGGQTGEVSARVAAALLNDPDVRRNLGEQGIHIPEATRFVPALHDTTTDEVTLFDTEELPKSAQGGLAQVRAWLIGAGDVARAERSESLELSGAPDLRKRVRARAHDWAQVRPEWGLANNAAFVVAPRKRTKHVNFQGRVFLHDYRHEDDHDGSILELIMTAPMVVTHWINMQYYASTVDNRHYGSGNKVLHNVVGGHVGVFEGNSGDLRIGLPMQSLHDGSRWVHEPLRLSVFIEAKPEAIERVIAKHENIRDLVLNEWIYLFVIHPNTGSIRRYQQGTWRNADGPHLSSKHIATESQEQPQS